VRLLIIPAITLAAAATIPAAAQGSNSVGGLCRTQTLGY